MKRKISFFLFLCLLLTTLSLPAAAYVRISYGADCLAGQAELIKTALRGDTFTFSETDFKQALGVTSVKNITILSLPDGKTGILRRGDTPITAGQIIDRADLSKMTFTPAAGFAGASFEFCAGSTAGTTALKCTLKVADRVNYAPTTAGAKEADLYVETAKNIAVYGKMHAADPEGDPLTYLILSYPSKGALTVTDAASGEFRYTPQAGKTGEDRFTYVARDSYGNYSYPTTVTVTVIKRNSTLVYADMEGHASHNAALTLAEKNIMLGSLEGAHMYFHPDEQVSRGEFLVMAMKSVGLSPAGGVTETWFDDDEKISAPIKGYVATAQLYGYINGSFDGKGLYFRPDEAITRAEAAVILNNLLHADTPAILPVFADASDIPLWAREAVYALHEARVFDATENGAWEADKPLSRAQAASALYAAMQYNG